MVSDSTLNTSAAALTHDPQRLQALCELWQEGEHDLWVTLQGSSMMPTLPPGSRLRLRCGGREPALGDVVAFRSGGRLVIHRLTHLDAHGRLVCQGDANAASDPPITPQEVVGVVVETQSPRVSVRVRRKIGSALRRLRDVTRWGEGG